MQKNETRPPSYTTHDNKFKMDQRLNIRPKTIKIVEENIGSKILATASSNILSDISPQAKETKEKINKWDYRKRKSLFTAKEIINRRKSQLTIFSHSNMRQFI